jgi:putative Mg2+ transporter-C (MgtC) family protein
MSLHVFLLRTGFALLMGALVGLERQWRQRTAGLRTNALVAVGAAFFATLAFKVDPSGHGSQQILAYVISGVGFLGAGAILRDGASVRGLNTAATLWCAAAVGLLSGCGYFPEAAIATSLVVGAHVALRPVARRLERAPVLVDAEAEWTFEIRVVCRSADEQRIRAMLLQGLTAAGLRLQSLLSQDAETVDALEVRAEVQGSGKADRTLEEVVGRLCLDGSVSAARWERRELVLESE